MRVSTSMMFESTSTRLSDLQSRLLKTQEQISTGRKYLTPADDPIASARAFDVSQSKAVNIQYGENRKYAKDSLQQEEGVLQTVTTLLQDVKTLTVNAGDGALDDVQRGFIANDIRGRFQELLSLANSRDGSGNFLFSGFQTAIQPFAQSATGATYSGDQGQRLLQVGASRQFAVGDSGTAVFELNKTGNGTFVTKAAAANMGAGVISSGVVVDNTQLTGHNYSLNFTVVGVNVTYDVVDTTTNTTLSTANVYAPGGAITFDGMQFDITGSPADGDVFTVTPSTNQSIFTTLTNLVNALGQSGVGAANQAVLTAGLNDALTNVDNALDNILTVRASVGARLKEINSLDDSGQEKDIQYAGTLADLQELDYTKAITSLTQQQTTLTAAQQSFVRIANLSLFNFLS
ncbi:MAG: flagellar hook-associated protein FlgL [Burkholderiales bacterium]|nr:flagellar hook-associated protein FlgL [Burkholderiales bacterium]